MNILLRKNLSETRLVFPDAKYLALRCSEENFWKRWVFIEQGHEMGHILGGDQTFAKAFNFEGYTPKV